jgi:uncharacterized protein
MKITFDQTKRDRTLKERELDFLDAHLVFAAETFTEEDQRENYGEKRMITVVYLKARMVVMVWTDRGEERRIISLRKANDREKARYGVRFGRQLD